MSVQSCSFQKIPGSEAPTFTGVREEAKSGSKHLYFVYISEILSNGSLILIQPLCPENTDSLKNGTKIIEGLQIAVVEMTDKGICLKTLQDRKKEINPKEVTLSLKFRGRITPLGPIKTVVYHDRKIYHNSVGVYGTYLKVCQSALQKAQENGAQKKMVVVK